VPTGRKCLRGKNIVGGIKNLDNDIKRAAGKQTSHGSKTTPRGSSEGSSQD